jgi:hypothetical protein
MFGWFPQDSGHMERALLLRRVGLNIRFPGTVACQVLGKLFAVYPFQRKSGTLEYQRVRGIERVIVGRPYLRLKERPNALGLGQIAGVLDAQGLMHFPSCLMGAKRFPRES